MKSSKRRVALVESYRAKAQKNEALGFEGIRKDASDLHMANGGGVQNRSTEPFKIKITNGSTAELAAPLEAKIFGFNKNSSLANFGSAEGIRITTGISNTTYAQLLAQSQNEPFEVVKMRISTTNVSQLENSILLSVSNSNGDLQQEQIDVSSYLSPNQNQDNLRDIDRTFDVDGNTELSYVIEADTTVTISFYIVAKINMTRTLRGRNAIAQYGSVRVRSFK